MTIGNAGGPPRDPRQDPDFHPVAESKRLLRSIRTVLFALPDATIVYPGHGPATQIGRERRENPFLEPDMV